ncbi:MAG: UPF0175 family protein [Candidatus Nanohaloarchaea archaeon]
MTTISARIPESLENEFEQFMDEEKLERSVALRKLVSEGLEEWKKEKALKQLEEGSTSFSKAAEIAGMNVWDFSDLLRDREMTWMKDSEFQEKDLEEA